MLAPSSACHSSGGRSSIASTTPTWLTGLFVNSRIARSATERPRNSQTSPVCAMSIASPSVIELVVGSAGEVVIDALTYVVVRWAKLLGVAGVVAVLGATGVAVYRQRQRRAWTEVPTDELRSRLHARLAGATADPAANAVSVR